MSPGNFCQTERNGRFLSELMRPHPFVKLNAIEGLVDGAFTFSIFRKKNVRKITCTTKTKGRIF